MSDAGWGPPNPAKHGHTEPVAPGGKSSNEATFYRFFWGWIEATAAEAVGLLFFRGICFYSETKIDAFMTFLCWDFDPGYVTTLELL